MENIKLLRQIPTKLLEADNVASFVIDGLRIQKETIIKKAKIEAGTFLECEDLLTLDAIIELKRIKNL